MLEVQDHGSSWLDFWRELYFSFADNHLLAMFWQVLFSVHAWEERATISLSYKDTNPIGARAYLYDFVHACILSCFSCVLLCVTLWTVAHKGPLPMGLSRKDYWSGLSCPPPGDLPNPGSEPVSLISPALAGRFFTTSAT